MLMPVVATERHTLSVLVDNEPGILARIAGLFTARGYNIESLTVSEVTADHAVSRITIVTSASAATMEQIIAQLDRLVPVHRVTDLTVLGNLRLVVEEGRYEHLREDAAGAPAPSALLYGCYVREVGLPPPSSWAGSDAQIVITGMHENGWDVTIAGPGAIGRDENGTLEISFERLPRIAVIGPEGLR